MNPDDFITVTKMTRKNRSGRQHGPNTIVREDIDTIMTTLGRTNQAGATSAEISKVVSLQEDIEAKENEVARLRAMLQREDEVDQNEAAEELKRLQEAFDRVQRQCQARLRPIEIQYNEALAQRESREEFATRLEKLVAERNEYINEVSSKANQIIGDMEEVKVSVVDEKPLYPLLQETTAANIQKDLSERDRKFDSFRAEHTKKLNVQLEEQKARAAESAAKSARRANTSAQDVAVRAATRKEEPITEEWYEASQRNQMLLTLLKEAQGQVDFLNSELMRIQNQNRDLISKLSQSREELIDLEKYLPTDAGEMHGQEQTERAKLTNLKTDSDMHQVNAYIADYKLKLEKSIKDQLEKANRALETQLPNSEKKLSDAKKKRQDVEVEVVKSEDQNAELLARRDFLRGEKECIENRIGKLSAKIEKQEKRIHDAQETIKKQEMTREINVELLKLRDSNLDRVAGTVSKLIQLKEAMG